MKPLYVEFAGLPGVGKSAVGQLVIERLNELGYRCGVQGKLGGRVRTPDGVVDYQDEHWRQRSRIERIIRYAVLVVRLRSIALPLLGLAARRPYDILTTLRNIRWLLLSVDKAKTAVEVAATGRSDLVVFDQGMLPCFRELIAATRVTRRDEVSDIVRPALDRLSGTRFLVVVLTTEVETIVERIGSRQQRLGPYDRMSSEEAFAILSRQSEFLEIIVESLVEMENGPEIARFRAAEPAAAIADRVVGVILERLSEWTSGPADGRQLGELQGNA